MGAQDRLDRLNRVVVEESEEDEEDYWKTKNINIYKKYFMNFFLILNFIYFKK